MYGDDVEIPMVETALPQPVSPYGVTKLAAEQLCHLYYVNFGVPCGVAALFHRVWPAAAARHGVQPVLYARSCEGRPLVQFGDGLQTRDFTFVADAARATADAAVRGVPGRVYNIGGGARVSLREVFDLIARVSGRKVTIDQQGPQKGDMRDTYADTSRARADLGFAPSVTLEEGLRADVALDGSQSMISDFGSSGFRIAWRCWCWPRPRWPGAPPRPTRCRRARRTRTSSCSIAAPRRRRKRSGSTRASTSATWSTTIRRARFGPTRSWRSATPIISEGGTENLLLAANEFREFLTFYPTHARADYAQLQLARAFTEQMLAPERDQAATKDAIKEIEIFLQRFPNSQLMPEARKMEREAKDRLSEANYRVGFFYYRMQLVHRRDRSLQGRAQDRSGIHATGTRVYYHLAESLYLHGKQIKARRPRRCRTTSGCSRNSRNPNISPRRKSASPS